MPEADGVDWGDLSSVFGLLADERCLYAILCLRESEGTATIRDLAAETAAKETGSPRGDVSEQRITRVHQALLHTHLPRLHEMKVIEYNRVTEYITLSCHSWKVETVIDAVADAYRLSAEDRV